MDPTTPDKHNDGDECESKRVERMGSPQKDFAIGYWTDFDGDRDEELKKQPDTIKSQINTVDNGIQPVTIRAVNIDRFITYFDKSKSTMVIISCYYFN